MANKCGKCDIAFCESDIIAKCVECKLGYHAACTKAGSSQRFTKSKDKSIRCDACAEETRSNASVRSSEAEEEKNPILEAIRQLKIDLNKNIEQKINTVLSSVNALQQDLKGIRDNINKLEGEQEKLRERCNKLEHENDGLSSVVRDLQQRLNDTEQHSRSSNLEIVGLPMTQNENIYDCLKHVADALRVNFKAEDISIAHRLRMFSGKRHSHPPIIAQFVCRSTMEAWLRAARERKHLNSSDVHPSLPRSSVFINNHLTPNNKALLGMARRLKREKKVVFAGFYNGKVLVKAAEGDETVRVTTLGDLEKYDRMKTT